jgi:hypothetical protein
MRIGFSDCDAVTRRTESSTRSDPVLDRDLGPPSRTK